MTSFFGELRRRNVVKVAVAYAIVGWILVEVSSTVFPVVQLPDWTVTFVTMLILLGFPLAMILSWAYDLTPQGIERTKAAPLSESITKVTGRKLDFAIIGALVLAVGFLLFNYVLVDEEAIEPAPAVADQPAEAPTPVVEEAQQRASGISVAVLAFEDLSPEGDQEYFSDGISEELLNLLADVEGLRVPSRTSSFSFKGTGADLQTIATGLNVTHVLEGSVRKAGNQIRITAQLIEAVTDTHLWSENYTRELTNVFDLQDEIAANVVEALRIELLGEPLAVRDGYRTDNIEAHDAYLLGRHRLAARRIDDLMTAREYFQTAIDLDPGYAAPYAALADTVNLLHFYGASSYDDVITISRPAIDQALALDPGMGEAYASRGFVSFWFEVDGSAAEADFLRAIELSPNYSSAYQWYGQYLANLQGRYDEGFENVQKALNLDPLSPIVNAVNGLSSSMAGQIEQARAYLGRGLEIAPGFAGGHSWLGVFDSTFGQVAEGLRRQRIAISVDPRSPIYPVMAGLNYVNLGDLERAQGWFEYAARLFGDGTIAQFYEAFIPLMVNREDPDRLISIMEDMPLVSMRWVDDEALFRAAVQQSGDRGAVRRYFLRHWPDLMSSYESAVGPHNYPAAVDLASLLSMEGEMQRADRLLDTSLAVLRQTPLDALSMMRRYRHIVEVRILALQGDEAGALVALRRAVDAGWRDLWWQAENDPTLASISGHPDFIGMIDEVRVDMVAQLEQVREMERNGEFASIPQIVATE